MTLPFGLELMPVKTTNSIEEYGKEIYKVLSRFQGRDIIRVSEFLKEIPIGRDFDPRNTYPSHAMIKSIILMKLKRIKFETELARFLRKNEQDAINLGFYRDGNNKILTPNRRTISNFMIHKITDEERELIDFIVAKIEEIAQKFGIIFDVDALEAKRKPDGTQKTIGNRKDKKLKELCRFVKKNIYSLICFPLRHNTVYTQKTYLDMLTHIAMTKDFTENGSKTYNLINTGKTPTATYLLNHITNIKETSIIQDRFKKAFEFAYKMAVRSGMINPRGFVDVAIDYTEWFYYGDKNDPMVVGKKPERGTYWCFKFASINIVEHGRRITLMVIPVGKLTNELRIIEEMINYTTQKVRIRKLYVDRHFFSSDMINLFKRMNLTFLMLANENSRIQKILKMTPSPTVITDYVMGDKDKNSVFNLVIVDREIWNRNTREKKIIKIAYATNMTINENDVELINKIPDLYRKRWGIETAYRIKKGFRAQTTSKNYKVRLMYFLYSALLYNLWVIIDSIISLGLNGKLIAYHLVTSKIFGTILYMIQMDPGG